MLVSVAIPVLNGGAGLGDVLSAVAGQRLVDGISLEVVVCDSGSSDDSVSRCEAAGARVLSIPRAAFSHGGTRNLLMEAARGELVAFLTQDAVPASAEWLMALVQGFELAEGVGLVYGPYAPREDASPMVARELTDWFGSLSANGGSRVDLLDPDERGEVAGVASRAGALDLYGPRAYFTDANGCISRAAWERVPFREIAYAEDHALALDMLWAGYAKVFVPDAAVVHSHDYTAREWLARSFDEARAIREVYGHVEPMSIEALVRRVGPLVRADVRAAGAGVALASALHHGARGLGGMLGGRSERLTRWQVRLLSLENR